MKKRVRIGVGGVVRGPEKECGDEGRWKNAGSGRKPTKEGGGGGGGSLRRRLDTLVPSRETCGMSLEWEADSKAGKQRPNMEAGELWLETEYRGWAESSGSGKARRRNSRNRWVAQWKWAGLNVIPCQESHGMT